MARGKRSKANAVRQYFGQLLLTKRGVYLISGDRRLRTFRLVPWSEILGRLSD